MTQKIRYTTTISPETIEQMKQIGEVNRWDGNDVIEVAIQGLHARIFNSPNPLVSVEEVSRIANPQPQFVE